MMIQTGLKAIHDRMPQIFIVGLISANFMVESEQQLSKELGYQSKSNEVRKN